MGVADRAKTEQEVARFQRLLDASEMSRMVRRRSDPQNDRKCCQHLHLSARWESDIYMLAPGSTESLEKGKGVRVVIRRMVRRAAATGPHQIGAATRDWVIGSVELKNAFIKVNRDHVVTGCTVASDVLGRVAYEWLQSDSQHVVSGTRERNNFWIKDAPRTSACSQSRLHQCFVQSKIRYRSGVLVGLSSHSWHIHAGNRRRCRLPGRSQLAARHTEVFPWGFRGFFGALTGSPRCRAGATRGATVLHTNQDRSSALR